jgi:hypothetical protein
MLKIILPASAALCLSTSVSAAAPPEPSAALSARPASVPMVGGAYLGMSIAAWKALPRPQTMSPRAVPSCSGADREGGVGAVRDLVAKPRGPIICSYQARYGAVSLPQALRLTPKYLARDPHYTFTGGRLSTIRFITSVDAFDALVAQFTQAYGSPQQTLRGSISFGRAVRFPRVQQVWRVGDQILQIKDPVGRPDRLEVELTTLARGPVA